MASDGAFEEYPVVRVFTFKDGLLSRFAHDLQLCLTDFDVRFSEGRISAEFRTSSIVVEGSVRDGKLDTSELSGSDCKKILRNVAEDVLRTDRYPEARYEGAVASDDDGVRVDGTLTMHGRRVACPTIRPVHVGSAWIASVELTPSRWGIRPYRAMAGALKIQDRIRIEIALPAGEDMDAVDTQTWRMRSSNKTA